MAEVTLMGFGDTLQKSRVFLRISGWFRNWRECLVGTWHRLRFSCHTVPANCVLLAEPNAFHGEILPGFVAYFQELGYEVTVLTRYANWTDNPFCRFAKPPRRYCLTISGMRSVLRSRKIHEFEYVLITSARSFLQEYRYFWRYLDFLKTIPSGKHGYGLIEHDLSRASYKNFWDEISDDAPAAIQLREHTFLLTSRTWRGHKIPMLNPHSFGDVKHIGSEGKRVFVTVGGLNGKSRDFQTLFDALSQLGRQDEFELWVVGRVKAEGFAEKCPANVHATGYLSFAEMYTLLEKADFLLALLDPEAQAIYRDGCTSGTRQLALGFQLIPVIHQAFAEPYGFSDENAILQKDNDLAAAFRTALDLSPEQLQHKRDALQAEARRVHDISLQNLKQRLG
ncbi:MAG: hypothetical protein IJJ26_01855 [Victivallales bacterium]|nr:hypothetical protein [Victivallales bacterium]